MSFKPLSCHLSPEDSHSLSGSHPKVYHDASSWIRTAAFVKAPVTVMSAEAVRFLGRWCIRSVCVTWTNTLTTFYFSGASILGAKPPSVSFVISCSIFKAASFQVPFPLLPSKSKLQEVIKPDCY